MSPMLIALLLVAVGMLAVVKEERGEVLEFTPVDWSVAAAGVVLALYVFMADAVRALPGGIEAVSRVRPTRFNWPLFLVALLAMAYPLMRALRSQARKS